jgi:hypothetical protein
MSFGRSRGQVAGRWPLRPLEVSTEVAAWGALDVSRSGAATAAFMRWRVRELGLVDVGSVPSQVGEDSSRIWLVRFAWTRPASRRG